MGWFSQKQDSSNNDLYASIESLDECIEKSLGEPVLILKHSSTCPISSAGKNQVDKFLQDRPTTAYLLIVQQQRPLSGEIAERLGVRHESPQLICLKNGEVARVFNHYEIVKDNLIEALEK